MKLFKLAGIVLLSLSLVNCGVLLHPERQGQTGGRIDPAVAILNGVGLLFFVIPGLVAYAIDFHQGTIYLPHSGADTTNLDKSARIVKIDGPITEEKIERVLREELGMVINLAESNVQVSEIDHIGSDTLHLAYAKP